jgi:hypothetical protein
MTLTKLINIEQIMIDIEEEIKILNYDANGEDDPFSDYATPELIIDALEDTIHDLKTMYKVK